MRDLGFWSSSWGNSSRWHTNYRGGLGQGDGGRRSVYDGAGERFGQADYDGGRFRTSMHGLIELGVGLSSALSEQGDVPRQNGTGGILSSFQSGFCGGKARLKRVSIAALDPEVRERYEAQVFYHATGDDV